MSNDGVLSPTIPNVLLDPLITVDPGGPARRLSLAELLARLLAGPEDLLSFPNVSAIQRSYWYRFLVRCGAKALHTLELEPRAAAKMDAAELAQILGRTLAAAAGGEEAWLLYQPDPALPAFLQPPTPDGHPPEKTYARNSASLLTTAIGLKMHERKYNVDRVLDAERMVYALVEFQGGVIFGGRGNYASQIMGSASGMGSGAPFMGVRLGDGYRRTFLHDVSVFLARWDRIRTDLEINGEIWALWTERWDGKSMLPASKLDPAFIPLARLVRLGEPTEDGDFDTVWFKATTCARVSDHSEGGLLGDIFTPLVPNPKRKDTWKVRGTMRNGYDYPEVVRLIFGLEAVPSPSVAALADPRHPDREGARIVFEGTAFEQGKTDGFHYREIPIPSTSTFSFFTNPEPLEEAHRTMLQMARDAKSAIRGAARILLAGSPKPRDGDGNKVDKPAQLLEHEIDRVYIPTLLAASERHAQNDMGYVGEWGETLTELTRRAFQESKDGIPTAGARRYEREIYAESWLGYRLRELRGEESGDKPGIDEHISLTEEVDA